MNSTDNTPNRVRSSTLTFSHPGQVLPTVWGKVSGVVAFEKSEQRGKSTMTVQCATCLRTATGGLIFAVNWANFAPDEGKRGTVPYRRCVDCQKAGAHPQQ